MKKVAYTSPQFVIILLSGKRSYSGHHRCVTLLYRIPMWIFDCVLNLFIAVKTVRHFHLMHRKLMQISKKRRNGFFIWLGPTVITPLTKL